MNRFFILLLVLLSTEIHAQSVVQRSAANPGITPYINYNAFDRNKDHLLSSPHVKNVLVIFHWRDLEPTPGGFVFEEAIGHLLKETKKAGVGLALKLWVGPSSPEWLYENGVPLVRVTGGADWKYPYYFSKEYEKYLYRFIDEFGKYTKKLSAEDVEHIHFLQVCEGSTGDTGPYQGPSKPINETYEIAKEDWMDYRMEVWGKYRAAMWKDNRTVLPMLFTDDGNTDRERDWQLANLPEFGVKKGQFAHGYNHNYFLRLMDPWQNLQDKAREKNVLLMARGEFDNILLRQEWVKEDLTLVFYWSALSALFHDINYWNPAITIIKEPELFLDGLDMYNTHVSSLGDPSQALLAFCAMRRMLDAADTETFPEDIYGKANPKNEERFKKILSGFASKGAKIGDDTKLGAGPIVSRTRKSDNDIGWMVYRGNFFKHLEQIEPETTSEAYWNVDTTKYGRFVRAFKEDSHNQMYFSLDKNFFQSAEPQDVRVAVIYKDSGNGNWELLYNDGQKVASAGRIKNADTDEWVEKVFTIENAVFNGKLDKSADLILKHISGDNTFFHLIELKRTKNVVESN